MKTLAITAVSSTECQNHFTTKVNKYDILNTGCQLSVKCMVSVAFIIYQQKVMERGRERCLHASNLRDKGVKQK